ncbi:MAG: aminoglycoside phosphotransferase family protein [Actinobacteria bacterium]|nr:aminoglycoside phosphotransferase family protein [Actinomycetota bacterium]
MGTDPAEPDWSPLTDPEVSAVLAEYQLDGADGAADAVVTWRSPRPMSAAALVRRGGTTVFVKRHDPRVRTASQLAAEHAFAARLRAGGLPVPAVLRPAAGGTSVTRDGYVYEVHETAPGADLYRDAVSWSPFASLGHARAAGAALARLHQAAAGFGRPARPMAVLTSSCAVITAPDPVAEVSRLAGRRPGLARALAGRDWQRDLARHLLPAIGRAAPLLAALPPLWGHGDWHPSNLTWTDATPAAQVAAVFDFGLANRTSAAHDLAVALERSTISWLSLPASGHPQADLDAAGALLDGYESVRPLGRAEAAALAEVLPVAHLEYALSEVEYFADVVHSPDNTELAYDGYLVGHARWFAGPDGAVLLDHLRRRARRGS